MTPSLGPFARCLALALVSITTEVSAAMVRLSAEDARALLRRHDLVVGEDTDEQLSVWTGAKKGLADTTASDGSAAWFRTKPDSWNLQWHWDHRRFVPGVQYVVYAVLKVRKQGSTGEAFKGGVWDKAHLRPVIPTTVVAADKVDDRVWMVFKMGLARPWPQQYVWIGTSGRNHDNVPEVWLDRFILAPDDSQPGQVSYLKLLSEHPNQPTFVLMAEKSASVTMELSGPDKLLLAMFALLPGKEAAAEVSVRYGLPAGAFGDPVRLTQAAGFRRATVDLNAHAPPDWTRITRVTFALTGQGRSSSFCGLILSPSRRALGLRQVSLKPKRGGATYDAALVDERTQAEARRMAFETPRQTLRGLLPGAKFAVRVGSSLRKYLYRSIDRDWVRPGVGDEARVSAAQHEYEGVQLVLIPLTETPVSGIRCSAGALVSSSELPSGGSLPRLEFNPVGYVKTQDLRHRYSVEHVGWWPDPLMPDGPVTLMPDRIQPIWTTVYVPEGTKPAEYRTVIRVTGDGHSVRVPLTVHVRRFALPRQTHLRSSFWLFRYHIRRFYGWDRVPWDVYKKYVDLATEHRLTPIEHSIEGGTDPYIKVYREPDGRLTFDYTDMDRYLAYVLDERYGNAFNVGYACWHHSVMTNLPAIDRATGKRIQIKSRHLSPEYVRIYTQFLRDYCAHLKRKGWFDKAYHQMIDEPRTDRLATVERLHRLSHEAAPDLKVLVTACWPPRLPQHSVDIWVPLTPRFKPEDAPHLKAQGDETWWYVCCGPCRPYANLFIDYQATDHRILFWQSWKYGAQGILYWGLNYWTGTRGKTRVNWPTSPEERWPKAPWVTNPCAVANGDGYSMYPGPNGAPLSSVRLEVMRDGMEDYEYLYLLDRLVRQLKRRSQAPQTKQIAGLVKDAETLLKVDSALVESMVSYTDDPEVILAHRNRAATAIERLTAMLSLEKAP